MSLFRIISTVEELVAASKEKTARYLILRNDLKDVPAIKMMPYQSLVGEFDGRTIEFMPGVDGFCLTKGNELKNLRITADPDRCAIYQDSEVENMNTHHLSRLRVQGLISFIIRGNVKKGRIDASFVHIDYATTMQMEERPNRYEVDMLQGVFTVWNQQEDLEDEIEADITHFSCGSETKPVAGSGLLLCGKGDKSGRIKSTVISCGHIYTKGAIAQGISTLVAAGVSIGYQVLVKNLNNYGRITCYGANEMGIYNWGTVERWSITDRIETHGPNGCGIINAGNIGKMTFTHEIETFGVGARGFYMFDGVAKDIHFERIVTRGDAACAIQFTNYIDRISVSGGIEVYGNALNVKFADTVMKASADGINVKPGGTIRVLKITGDVIVHGNEANAIHNEGGIEQLLVSGKVLATGEVSKAMSILNGYLAADSVTFESEKWTAIRLENAKINNCHNLVAKGKDFDILIDILSSVNRNVFSPEFLEGIFQKDVRLEYIDNVEHPKAKPEPNLQTKHVVEDITPKDNGAQPMSCKPPKKEEPEA